MKKPMADSFFGFDTSSSNINDDEGGGGPSEDEYDALNDETFGQADDIDWEVEHEHLAGVIESSRRHKPSSNNRHNLSDMDHMDEVQSSQLEASLSQLVLDESDSGPRMLSSSVWRHDSGPFNQPPLGTKSIPNVCTVEELERQMRQKQHQQQQQMPQQQQNFGGQNYFQPRFPVILQRPPGLQAPVSLPFAPQQQNMTHNVSQTLNNILGQSNQMNPLPQPMQNMNHMGQNMNQMGGPHPNQMGQSVNQMGQSVNQMGQSVNQMGQNVNQFLQNANQMNQFQNNQMGQKGMINSMPPQNLHQQNHMIPNQMGQNFNQMAPNNMMGPNINQIGQNMNQMGQNMNQMGQSMNPIGPNVNQLGQNNQMLSNGNQFPGGMNQFQQMGQSRMMGPPPGITMQRQSFNSNVGQYNPNFRNQPPPKSEQPPMNPHQQPNMMNQQMYPQQQLNQSPQMTPNKISAQSPQKSVQQQKPLVNSSNKNDPKAQKTRVYNNNTQQKGMNLQNLVQMIHNTIPLFSQYNTNSYHNASHHPILNNSRNIYGPNNMFANNVMGNQRNNGSYSNNNRNLQNGDSMSPCSDMDEYAGLMSPREKQWLINIQMLQLSTGTPYIHDFYYTVFLERQSQKEKEFVKEAHKANQQNHPFYSGGVKQETRIRSRHNSLRHNSTSEESTPRTYVPTQFENSLGKLQCGSVTAPRKIIDLEVVAGEPASGRISRAASVASTNNPYEAPREMKRTKQLLLDIEALYLVLLKIEELNDPLAISNALILKEREEKQKQLEQAQNDAAAAVEHEEENLFLKNIESVQKRPKQESPKSENVDKRQVVNLATPKPVPVKNLLDEDKDELIAKMFAGLLHGDRLVQMMHVRKGRSLVCRFVRRVGGGGGCGGGGHGLRALWSRVLRALPSVARRDADPLHTVAHCFHRYIQNSTGWASILESCSSLSEAFDPARTPYALTTPFTLSCVCAIVDKASSLTNTPDATANERQYYKFLKTLARALKNTSLAVAKPVQPIAEKKLMAHLKQMESRTTIEILQRGRPAEFTDISKTDVTEQLVNHLC